MKLGPNTIDIVSDGSFLLDGGAMCGVVPKPLWSRLIEPDENNRIPLASNCMLVRGPSGTIVVETGFGGDFSEKQEKIFAFDYSNRLLDSLSARGVSPEDVDMVIQTHLHFDHCGTLTTRSASGAYAPTFPNAEVLIQRGDWEAALKPDLRTKPSYYEPEFYLSIERAGRLRLLDGDAEVAPDVRVRRRSGHSPGHQIVEVSSDGEKVVYLGDFVPMHYHLQMPYIMAFDLYPMVTLEHKLETLPELARPGVTVIFEHDTRMPAATLREENGRIVADPVDLS